MKTLAPPLAPPPVNILRPRGFTTMELIVVVGIIAILASLVLPLMSSMRSKALKIQCASNLRQLHQALTMYSVDSSRLYEVYPMFVTYLSGSDSNGAAASGYVTDERIYVCPADNTRATRNAYNVASLKPIYSTVPMIPADDKHDWAERVTNGNGQRNCSYLYEFSGRVCETYTADDFGGSWDGTPNTYCDTMLISVDDPSFCPNPNEVDRNGAIDTNGHGVVTWQDAKFAQLAWGDAYRSGNEDYTAGNFPQPPPAFDDPIDYYFNANIDFDNYLNGYPRVWMPILRCFWHQTPARVDNEAFEEVQNISLDGTIFSSSPFWERSAFKYGPKTGNVCE